MSWAPEPVGKIIPGAILKRSSRPNASLKRTATPKVGPTPRPRGTVVNEKGRPPLTYRKSISLETRWRYLVNQFLPLLL